MSTAIHNNRSAPIAATAGDKLANFGKSQFFKGAKNIAEGLGELRSTLWHHGGRVPSTLVTSVTLAPILVTAGISQACSSLVTKKQTERENGLRNIKTGLRIPYASATSLATLSLKIAKGTLFPLGVGALRLTLGAGAYGVGATAKLGSKSYSGIKNSLNKNSQTQKTHAKGESGVAAAPTQANRINQQPAEVTVATGTTAPTTRKTN